MQTDNSPKYPGRKVLKMPKFEKLPLENALDENPQVKTLIYLKIGLKYSSLC